MYGIEFLVRSHVNADSQEVLIEIVYTHYKNNVLVKYVHLLIMCSEEQIHYSFYLIKSQTS